MSATRDFDLFVIGGGSGGVRAARMAARYGARVAIAEAYRYGGTCVIRGCVPKKLLVYASQYADHFEDARGFGWTVPDVSHDWPTLIARKDAEIDRLNGIYIRMLEDAGVTVMHGRAVLSDPFHVTVGRDRISAEKILVATGAKPFVPPIPGAELGITSNEALHLNALKERVVIVGGGYVAVEFAGIFASLGRSVHLVVRGDNILRGFEPDVRELVAEQMRSRGVKISSGTEVRALETSGADLVACLSDGQALKADHVLFATGRPPNTEGLGLPEVGVALGARREIPVDRYAQTQVPHIYAVGDCTDRIALTPVAIAEGQAFADTVFGGKPTPFDNDVIPTAVFGQPSCASVGMTTEAALQKYGALDIYESRFRPMKATLSGRQGKTLTKLIVAVESHKVVGIHMVGDDAAEIIQSLAVAVQMGATKEDFDRTLALHPSTAEEFVLMRQSRRLPAS